MRHRQDRRRPDACGQQDDRTAVFDEVEIASWGGGLDRRPGLDMGVQPPAHLAVVLALDAYSVIALGGVSDRE